MLSGTGRRSRARAPGINLSGMNSHHKAMVSKINRRRRKGKATRTMARGISKKKNNVQKKVQKMKNE